MWNFNQDFDESYNYFKISLKLGKSRCFKDRWISILLLLLCYLAVMIITLHGHLLQIHATSTELYFENQATTTATYATLIMLALVSLLCTQNSNDNAFDSMSKCLLRSAFNTTSLALHSSCWCRRCCWWCLWWCCCCCYATCSLPYTA